MSHLPPTTDSAQTAGPIVAVVIPCYRVTRAIEGVIAGIGSWCHHIVCVDDCCPDASGDFIRQQCKDPRIHVVKRPQNGGVGAATLTGYGAALELGADILVKVDGDGQMDPRLVPDLIQPIRDGEADYVKGNRFFSRRTIAAMPTKRMIGNAGLSFMTKMSTGYWNLFDPTNGFTAIAAPVAGQLPFEELHPRFFFESDMLYQLSILRAKVVEMPQIAVYGDEESNLSELNALLTFPGLHTRNFLRRLFFNYFIRNFSAASLSLVVGAGLTVFGVLFGVIRWSWAIEAGDPNTAGTVMLAALPVLLGIQLLLSFLQLDIAATPNDPIHRRLRALEHTRD